MAKRSVPLEPGTIFGSLTLVHRLPPKPGTQQFILWLCRCSCGREFRTRQCRLVRKRKHFCCPSCAMTAIQQEKHGDLTGRTFGKWTVIGRAPNGGDRAWECRCACGTTLHISGCDLTNGRRKSCIKCQEHPSIRLRPYEALFNTVRKFRTGGRAWSITYEQFLTFTAIDNCRYCGAEIKWSKFSKQYSLRYNLDRKNNTEDYTFDNCVVCCKRCNYAKGNRYTYEEWWGMTAYFRNRQGAKTCQQSSKEQSLLAF